MRTFLRWFVIILILVFVGSLAALAYFWKNFDPNRYRPFLERQLSKQTHFQTELGTLSLDWKGGLGLHADWLRLRRPEQESPFIEVRNVLLGLRPVSGALLRPQIRLAGEALQFNFPTGAHPTQVLAFHFTDFRASFELPVPNSLNFNLELQEKAIRLTGNVVFGPGTPQFALNFNLGDLDLETLAVAFASRGQGRGEVAGRASGSIELKGLGVSGPQISHTLLGKGSLEIRRGALKNYNVVKGLLSQITMIPGLIGFIQEAPLGPFQDILSSPDTSFDRADLEFKIEQGQIFIAPLSLVHKHYTFSTSGQADFEARVNFKGRLVLLEPMSQYLIHRVNEIQLLMNRRGEIEIPFIYRGALSNARPLPDLGSLAGRVIMTQGSQMMQRGLETLSKIIGEKRQ